MKPQQTSEHLAVLGEPSEFRSNIIDPTWKPSSDWNNDPGRNNFAPSSWAESVIGPDWQPESAFDPDEDVLQGSRSTFRKSIIDPSWQPTDGFSKRKTSWSARARPTTSSLTARRITPLGEPTLAPRPWPEAFGAAVAAPGVRFRFSVSSPRARTDRGIDPRSCAEQILHARADVQQLPHDIRVEAMDDDRFATLPIPIYAAEESIDGTVERRVDHGFRAVIDRQHEARLDRAAVQPVPAPVGDRRMAHVGIDVDARHQTAGEAEALGDRVVVHLVLGGNRCVFRNNSMAGKPHVRPVPSVAGGARRPAFDIRYTAPLELEHVARRADNRIDRALGAGGVDNCVSGTHFEGMPC